MLLDNKEKLRVLFVSPLLWWKKNAGAVSTYLSMKGYVDAGCEVHLVTWSNCSPDKEIMYDGIHVHYFDIPLKLSRPPHDIFNMISIDPESSNTKRFLLWLLFVVYGTLNAHRVAAKVKPHMVYGLYIYGIPVAFLIHKFYNIPNMTRMFGTWLHTILDKPIQLWKNWIDVLAFKLPCERLIITNDGTLGDKVAERFKVPKEKICFWVNGVDKDIYVPDLPTTVFREKLNISNETIIVFTLSRLVEWKHVDRLVSAVPNIVKENQNVIFLIVGDGPERGNLETLAKELRVEEYIRFVGVLERHDLKYYFNSADIFVSFYDLSNVGNTLLEALVCGKAIVTLDVGGTSSVIKNGDNGILLNPERISELPSTILKLINEPQLRKRLGEKAKAYADLYLQTWEERMRMEVQTIVDIVNEHTKG